MQKITRQDVIDALAVHEADSLRAVLVGAHVEQGEEQSPHDLAERIATTLWWNYCTPLGYVANQTSLDDIVDHVARKLQLAGALTDGDAWSRLGQLTQLVLREPAPAALEDLDPKVRARLVPSWKRTAVYASGATGSFGAMAVGKGVVYVSRTQLGRLLPYLPHVGPWVRTIYRGGGAAAVVGGPAGIALSILTANNALGTNYQRLVPLLLGIGALGVAAVQEAVEVPPTDEQRPADA
ncbi:MAG: hypothetical protein JRI25_10945 [Deltaproteobacteria bacterium]|nr:hypothetical protein [Deltaproteobacteria bacterium]